MKNIGEQAKEFREARGWSYTRMAEEVSKYTATPVNRQKITQLEQVGARQPRYLDALATAMGTTTDALLTGRVGSGPPEWPFPEISREDFEKLTDSQKQQLQGAVLSMMIRFSGQKPLKIKDIQPFHPAVKRDIKKRGDA